MYEAFYGLRGKPFQLAPDPALFYRSSKHEAALTYLEYGALENTGFILLTGEIGSGKTTLVHYLIGLLPPSTEAAVVFNTNGTPAELLGFILEGFGLARPQGDRVALLKTLARHLAERLSQGKRPLLILDEAQNLSAAALEEVRLLSNLRRDGKPLLAILLVGQPELALRIEQPELRHFSQRIAARYHLAALDREETGDYIAFRLRQAGGNVSLFDPAAVDLIHELTLGIPRAINLTCHAALVYGFAQGAATIGAEIIRQVREDRLTPGLSPAVPDTAAVAGAGEGNGNGLRQGIDALGTELRLLKRAMDERFQMLQNQRLERVEAAFGRMKDLLRKAKARNLELARQNQLFRALALRLQEELKRRPER